MKKIFALMAVITLIGIASYALDTLVVADSVTGVASRTSSPTLGTLSTTTLNSTLFYGVTVSGNTLVARTANITTTLTAATVTASTIAGSALRLHGLARDSFETVGVSFNRSVSMNINGDTVMLFYYKP